MLYGERVNIDSYYEWFKVAHIIFFTSWMAGMFYLPRLFIYHCQVKKGSEEDKRFQLMEQKLLRIIINPSMVATIVFGVLLAYIYGFGNLGGWFHTKMLLVVFMTGLHGFFASCRRKFKAGTNKYGEKFYRIVNEAPVVIFVLIVILVKIKPFE